MIEQTEHLSSSGVLKVFLGGLPFHWESDQVTEFMHAFGKVVGVQLKKDTAGYGKGYGFVYLEDHLDPKQLYGKHHFGDSMIEIKELKQKHIYMSLGSTGQKLSEAYLVQMLLEFGHPTELIEVGGRATQRVPNIAKITFVHDSSAKYFLHRKFVDIDRVSYNVYSSIDYQKPRISSPSSPQVNGKSHQTQMIGKEGIGDYGHSKRLKNQYNYHDYNQDEKSKKEEFKVESHKSKKTVQKTLEDSHKQTTIHQDTVIENEIVLQPKVSVVQNSTQSSDDQLSTGKTKAKESATKPTRKLSYKGKEIEFHPTLQSEEPSQLLLIESSPRTLEMPSGFSTSSRDQYSSISKLSSSSVDWKLENLLMWPQAGYNPQMLYSLYSQMPASAAYYPPLKKPSEWLAQKEPAFEPHKKKDVRIEFFTFPGFV